MEGITRRRKIQEEEQVEAGGKEGLRRKGRTYAREA